MKETGDFSDPVDVGQNTEDSATRNSQAAFAQHLAILLEAIGHDEVVYFLVSLL